MATCPPPHCEALEDETVMPSCGASASAMYDDPSPPPTDLDDGSTCSVAANVSTLTMQLLWSDAAASPTEAAGDSSVRKCAPAHPVDLDLMAMLVDKDGNALELVSFLQTRAADGSSVVLTSGDQCHGAVGEVLTVHLHKLPPYISTIALVVLSPDTSVAVSDVASVTLQVHYDAPCNATTTTPGRCCLRYVCVSKPSERTTDPRSMRLIASVVRCRTSGWTFGTHRDLLRGVTLADPLPAICRAVGLPPNGDVHFKFPLSLRKGDDVRIWTAPRGEHAGEALNSSASACQDDIGNLVVGIGWDIVDLAGDAADVDLSCIAVNVARGEVVDMLYWAKVRACGDALVHSGDNTTGEGEGIDESVHVQLGRLPLDVTAIVFSVSSYNTESLDALKNIFFVVGREKDEAELIRMEYIGCGGTYSTYIPCALIRGRDMAWHLRVLSLTAPGRSVTDEALRSFMLQAVCNNGSASLADRLNLRRAALEHQRAHSGRGTTARAGQGTSACERVRHPDVSRPSAHAPDAVDGWAGLSRAARLQFVLVVAICCLAIVIPQFLVASDH